MADLWATDSGRAAMADYFERLTRAPSGVYSALLFLHENPQDFTEHWALLTKTTKRPKWERLANDGFIKYHYSKRRRKAKPLYTLADENVTWLLIEVLQLILRRIEKERASARALLRYASSGPENGDFEQTLVFSPRPRDWTGLG